MSVEIGSLKILVVEDRKDARTMIKNMLIEIGVSQVYEASDGREGLSFMDVAPELVDVVVCDWNMPEMNGISLLRQVRTVYPQMPFLMVTGRSDYDSVSEAKMCGATAYIRKPFSPNQMEAKLRAVCQRMRPDQIN